MKRFLSLLLSVILIITCLTVTASAATTEVTLTPEADTVTVDGLVTLTVKLGENVNGWTADKIDIRVNYSSQFELISGEFLQTEGAEQSIDIKGRTASISYEQSKNISGDIFKFQLKGLSIANDPVARVTVVAKNGSTQLFSRTTSLTLKIICREHSFTRFETTKSADCENAGEQTRKCTVCEFRETQVIEAYGHDFSNMEILRPATCIEKGYERGFCSRCNQKLLQEIPAKGHTMGEWTTVKKPSCVKNGLEQSKCQSCDHTESRKTDPIGHEFQEAVITTEPTISTNGIKTGYCTRCSDTTTAEVPCAHTDSATGIRLDTTYGVFPEGTKVKIESVGTDSSDYNFVRNSLAHITNRFIGYNIETTHRGSEVHPDGEVTVTFNIPEKYGKSASFYYINENGAVKKLSATLSEDGTKATIKLVDTGHYAICKTGFDAGASRNSLLESISLTELIIWTSVVLVICWSIVALKIIKMKKPALYKKIMPKLPKYSQIRNAVLRQRFIIKEKSRKFRK